MTSCAVRMVCLEASSQADGDPELAWQTAVNRNNCAAADRHASVASKGGSSGRRAKQLWWAQVVGQCASCSEPPQVAATATSRGMEEEVITVGNQAIHLLPEGTLASLLQQSTSLGQSSKGASSQEQYDGMNEANGSPPASGVVRPARWRQLPLLLLLMSVAGAVIAMRESFPVCARSPGGSMEDSRESSGPQEVTWGLQVGQTFTAEPLWMMRQRPQSVVSYREPVRSH